MQFHSTFFFWSPCTLAEMLNLSMRNAPSFKLYVIFLLFLAYSSFVFAENKKFDSLIEARIQRMTIEEKVGQLFLVGFPQNQLSPDLEKFIATYKPGAFLLFKRNIRSAIQVRDFNQALYRASFKYTKLPPLIAIDQEGGSVSRLPIEPSPPNALALGQTQSPLLAEEMGHQTGLFLREVGFNMNLAPVLDIADPLQSSFIGVRSFGANPALVAEIGTAYSRGLLRARVIPTAKHFPGTGSLNSDPHIKVVRNLSSYSEMQERDLKPFVAYAVLSENSAMMLSHLIYPSLDNSGEPASFSRQITHGLLREKLRYQGLVVTDDLQMQGSKQLLRPEVAALRALQAGSDIVMLTWSFKDQEAAFNYVKKAVASGQLSKEELDAKLKRILRVKAYANLYRRDPQQPSLLQGLKLTSKGYINLESDILDKNLQNSLAQSSVAKVPASRSPASVGSLCVISPSGSFIESFRKSTSRRVATKILAGSFTAEDVQTWVQNQKCTLLVAAVTGPKTAGLIKSFKPEQRRYVVAVNLAAPRLVRDTKGYMRVIQLYFNHAESGKKIAQHLEEILNDPANSYVSL